MSRSLQEICAVLSLGNWGSGIRLPEKTKLGQMAADLPPVALSTRPPDDFIHVAREISGCVMAGKPLSRRQVQEAPWCLWHEEVRLAEQPYILNVVLAAVAEATRPSVFSNLATVFTNNFDPEGEGISAVSSCLQRLAEKWDTPWALLHRDFSLFDVRLGPRRLAAAVIAQGRSAPDIIGSYGIGEMVAKSGYVRAVTVSILEQLANGEESDHLRRLAKVERYALDDGGRPSFDGLLGKIAEALLMPFGQSRPETALRDRFLSVLLRLLGDPRLKSKRHNWSDVPDILRYLVTSWLSDQSLRQFLDVVDEIAKEQMWKYRRAFWEGLYEYYRQQGVYVDAWVAFGPKGSQRARESFGPEASFAKLGRSSTSDKYVRATHAVLLLRIGDVIVADWNEDGMCHIWSSYTQDGAPSMHKEEYESGEVQIHTGRGNHETETELTWRHGGSETMSWQNKIAGRLEHLIGLRIPRSIYRI